MKKPVFGQLVTVTTLCKKHVEYDEAQRCYVTKFISEPCSPREGIYIGYRWLPEGITIRYYEEGSSFHRKTTRFAYLVVFSERTNPVYCDLEL